VTTRRRPDRAAARRGVLGIRRRGAPLLRAAPLDHPPADNPDRFVSSSIERTTTPAPERRKPARLLRLLASGRRRRRAHAGEARASRVDARRAQGAARTRPRRHARAHRDPSQSASPGGAATSGPGTRRSRRQASRSSDGLVRGRTRASSPRSKSQTARARRWRSKAKTARAVASVAGPRRPESPIDIVRARARATRGSSSTAAGTGGSPPARK